MSSNSPISDPSRQQTTTPSSSPNSLSPSRPDLILDPAARAASTSLTPNPNLPQATLIDGLRTISPSDFLTLPQHLPSTPCFRTAALSGLTTAFFVGGSLTVLRGVWRTWNNMSWAIGTGLTAAAGAHEFCRVQKRMERDGMRQAMKIMEEKKKEKEERMRLAREEVRRRRKEEEEERRRGWGYWMKTGGGLWRSGEESDVRTEGEIRAAREMEERKVEEEVKKAMADDGKKEREVRNVTKSRAAGEWS